MSDTVNNIVITKNEVVIVDIKMPFWSMVVFMVKAAIAAIPAIIILSVLGVAVMGLLGGLASA